MFLTGFHIENSSCEEDRMNETGSSSFWPALFSSCLSHAGGCIPLHAGEATTELHCSRGRGGNSDGSGWEDIWAVSLIAFEHGVVYSQFSCKLLTSVSQTIECLYMCLDMINRDCWSFLIWMLPCAAKSHVSSVLHFQMVEGAWSGGGTYPSLIQMLVSPADLWVREGSELLLPYSSQGSWGWLHGVLGSVTDSSGSVQFPHSLPMSLSGSGACV